MIEIHHNFDEKKFKWLWAKYVYVEVAKAEEESPIKGNPLTISYDIPN